MTARQADESAQRAIDELAEEYQIPAEQVRLCLERLTATFARESASSAELLWEMPFESPSSLFVQALQSLPHDQAIELISTGDLPAIIRRARAVEYLTKDDVPFYTLQELSAHARHFSIFLDENREFLVRTGLPPRGFSACRWLYIHLGRLYDTRIDPFPISVPR